MEAGEGSYGEILSGYLPHHNFNVRIEYRGKLFITNLDRSYVVRIIPSVARQPYRSQFTDNRKQSTPKSFTLQGCVQRLGKPYHGHVSPLGRS